MKTKILLFTFFLSLVFVNSRTLVFGNTEWVKQANPGLPPEICLTPDELKIQSAKVEVEETDKYIKVTNGFISISIDKHKGNVISYELNGKNVLESFTGSELDNVPLKLIIENRKGLTDKQFYIKGKTDEVNFSNFEVKVSRENIENGIIIIVDGTHSSGISIKYWVIMLSGDPKTYWRLKVSNTGKDVIVDEFTFPYFVGLKVGEDKNESWFTWPEEMGARIKLSNFQPGKVLTSPYPHYMYMQWLELFNDKKGFYMACNDDWGYYKELTIGKSSFDSAFMGFNFKGTWIKTGDSWVTPWFSISFHNNDWHTGADYYRFWSEKAFGLPAPPEIVWDLPGSNCWLAWFNRITDASKIYEVQQKAPIHSVYIPSSMVSDGAIEAWDEWRGCALDYKTVAVEIRKLGGIPGIFLWPIIPNSGTMNVSLHAQKWLTFNREGNFDTAWGDITPCPYEDDYSEICEESVARYVRMGYGEIHFDAAGGGTHLCYNPEHKHRPNEYPHYLKQFYHRCKEAGKKIDTNFFLRTEHCADFFFPEFELSTIHGFVAVHSLEREFGLSENAKLMPELFRYTLPRYSTLQTPGMGGNDFWEYGYGPGYAFHGGGACWSFNPGVREPEITNSSVEDNYSFYDTDWQIYYNWRVGFKDAVVQGKVIGENVIAENTDANGNKREFKCEYPGPLVCCSFLGNGRQITLGYWYHLSKNGEYAKKILPVNREPVPEKILLKIKNSLSDGVNPKAVYLYKIDKIEKIDFKKEGEFIVINVTKPNFFAVELVQDIHFELQHKKIVYMGETVELALKIENYTKESKKLNITMYEPSGWEIITNNKNSEIELKPDENKTVKYNLKVPADIIMKNYPVKVKIVSQGKETYTATVIKVLKKFDFYYSINEDNEFNKGEFKENCIVTGKDCKFIMRFINNQENKVKVNISIDSPAELNLKKNNIQIECEGIKGDILISHSLDHVIGTDDTQAGIFEPYGIPDNTVTEIINFKPSSIPENNMIKINYEVVNTESNEKITGTYTINPRIKIVNLNGRWKYKGIAKPSTDDSFNNTIKASVGYASPQVDDGEWNNIKIPGGISETSNDVWGIWRYKFSVPENIRGDYVGIYLPYTGTEARGNGFYNAVFINGWPVGSVRFQNEINISQYIKYGKENLITVFQYLPKGLWNPYVFVK